jgi:hypothetical protein
MFFKNYAAGARCPQVPFASHYCELTGEKKFMRRDGLTICFRSFTLRIKPVREAGP